MSEVITLAKEYNTERKPNESLIKWYRRLAKTADQRLVRLESYKYDKHFKNIEKWAYKKAIDSIHSWSGERATRFNTAPPKDDEKLLAKINEIRNFIEMKTSTKAGIIRTYDKMAKTTNEKYGTSFTWEDLATYYESETNKKWSELFGSDTALRIIGIIQKNKDLLSKEITEATLNNLKIDADTDAERELLREQLKIAINSNDVDINDFIS